MKRRNKSKTKNQDKKGAKMLVQHQTGQASSTVDQTGPKPIKEPQITFSLEAWITVLMARNEVKTEITMFGVTDENDPTRVVSIEFVKHEATTGTVEFDDDALAEYTARMAGDGIAPWRCRRVWIHTHPGDSVEPSTTDWGTFWEHFDDVPWGVMVIVGQGGSVGCHMNIKPQVPEGVQPMWFRVPTKVMVDEIVDLNRISPKLLIEHKIDLTAISERVSKAVRETCLPKTYAIHQSGGAGYGQNFFRGGPGPGKAGPLVGDGSDVMLRNRWREKWQNEQQKLNEPKAPIGHGKDQITPEDRVLAIMEARRESLFKESCDTRVCKDDREEAKAAVMFLDQAMFDLMESDHIDWLELDDIVEDDDLDIHTLEIILPRYNRQQEGTLKWLARQKHDEKLVYLARWEEKYQEQQMRDEEALDQAFQEGVHGHILSDGWDIPQADGIEVVNDE